MKVWQLIAYIVIISVVAGVELFVGYKAGQNKPTVESARQVVAQEEAVSRVQWAKRDAHELTEHSLKFTVVNNDGWMSDAGRVYARRVTLRSTTSAADGYMRLVELSIPAEFSNFAAWSEIKEGSVIFLDYREPNTDREYMYAYLFPRPTT